MGLLKPAYVGSNGYRCYGRRDQVAALRGHEEWLRGERDRLDRLANTVSRTIRHCKEESR